MKINDINRIGAVNPYRKNTNTSESSGIEKKNKKQDEVQISAQAKELMSAKAGEASHGQKIEELKHSVSTGTYHVDAGKIAEKLLPFIK